MQTKLMYKIATVVAVATAVVVVIITLTTIIGTIVVFRNVRSDELIANLGDTISDYTQIVTDAVRLLAQSMLFGTQKELLYLVESIPARFGIVGEILGLNVINYDRCPGFRIEEPKVQIRGSVKSVGFTPGYDPKIYDITKQPPPPR